MSNIIKRIKEQGGEHFLFVGATIISAGVHFLYSIFIKVYILPVEYGMYSTCVLLQTYLAYLQLGTLNAFNRDYPQLIGAGNVEGAKKYRNTVFSFLILVYSIAMIILVGVVLGINFRVKMDEKLMWGFILVGVTSFATIVENFGNYRCRIDKGFKFPSLITILELVSVAIGIYFAARIGYYALYITPLLAMVIGVFGYYRKSIKDIEFGIDKKILRVVLISGAPLLINGLIWTVVNSIDKFVILGFMDTEQLGIYGIAQNAFSYMVLIPSTMSQLFYVKMGKEYGAKKDSNYLTSMSIKYTTLLGGITSLMALVAYFFLPILVDLFMKNYNNGVPAAQILILGLSIYAATLINNNVLTILQKNAALLKSSIYMCIFNLLCSVGYVMFVGKNIESVALGTATSYVLCAGIIIYQVYKYTGCKISRLVKASVLPVIISLAPGAILYAIVPNRLIGFVISLIIVLLFYLLFYKRTFEEIIKEFR